MKKIENYKIVLIKIHAWKCQEGTNNTVFYNAGSSVINDKKLVFPPQLKKSLGLPEHMNSFYDQKKNSGAYERLWDLTIISLCSDIEYFFKDLFQDRFSDENFNFGFYQRVKDVIKRLEESGFDFSKIKNEVNSILECFQVRHIAIHNMGYVDEAFRKNVGSSLQIGEKFVVTQETYKGFYNAYLEILDTIDEHLFRENS